MRFKEKKIIRQGGRKLEKGEAENRNIRLVASKGITKSKGKVR